eukprot:1614167-Amphidinium_carterae.1
METSDQKHGVPKSCSNDINFKINASHLILQSVCAGSFHRLMTTLSYSARSQMRPPMLQTTSRSNGPWNHKIRHCRVVPDSDDPGNTISLFRYSFWPLWKWQLVAGIMLLRLVR